MAQTEERTTDGGVRGPRAGDPEEARKGCVHSEPREGPWPCRHFDLGPVKLIWSSGLQNCEIKKKKKKNLFKAIEFVEMCSSGRRMLMRPVRAGTHSGPSALSRGTQITEFHRSGSVIE